MGVIRSRENSGLRSTTDMMTIVEIDNSKINRWGVIPANLIEAWTTDDGALDSKLILEGGNF